MNEATKVENSVTRCDGSYSDRVLELALSQGAALDQLERFLNMKREEEKYEAKKAYFAAMARAQGNIPTVIKNKNNTQTHSKYAEYSEIVAAAQPALSAEGIFVTFYEGDSPKENHIRVYADVSHALGYTREPPYYYDCPMDGKGLRGNENMTAIHAKASSIQYARRYLMGMILNIATGDDTDGNQPKPKAEHITEEQAKEIDALITKTYKDTKVFWRWISAAAKVNVESADQIPAKAYGMATDAIKKAQAAAKPQREPGIEG